jgi:hypothetical protein
LSKNESGYFYYEDDTKLSQFENFLQDFPEDYDIVSVSELQAYIDRGEVISEFILPTSSLENECHK